MAAQVVLPSRGYSFVGQMLHAVRQRSKSLATSGYIQNDSGLAPNSLSASQSLALQQQLEAATLSSQGSAASHGPSGI